MELERGFTVHTTDFAQIADEFHNRVSRMVWCNVATVDEECRPRSRILHPMWDGSDGWIGVWLTSTQTQHQTPSLKIRHLTTNPHVSLAYVADVAKPVYVDGTVDVRNDLESKRRLFDLANAAPPPYGYDPGQIFGDPDNPRFGVLRVTPTRIALVEFPAPPGKVIVWRSGDDKSTQAPS